MKQCPNCKKKYTDDLFFCLDHGLPLVTIGHEVDPTALTEANINARFDGKTERMTGIAPETETIEQPKHSEPFVVPIRQDRQKAVQDLPVAETPPRAVSKLVFFVIGLLAATCIALVAALLYSNRGRFLPEQAVNTKTPEVARPTPVPTQTANASASPSPSTNTKPEAKPVSAVGAWKGEWRTDSGTLFDFELSLTGVADNGLDGRVKWTMRRTARPDKTDKIGFSATEYLRGSYDPVSGKVMLKGYRKDDPDEVLVMLDEYKLQISPDGRRLTGLARNGGKWNGKVELARRAGD